MAAASTATRNPTTFNSNAYYYSSHKYNQINIISFPNRSLYYLHTQPNHSKFVVPRCSNSDPGKPKSKRKTKPQKNSADLKADSAKTEAVQEQEPKQQSSVSLSLDDVNPVGLGRKSRQIFDEVWRKFSGLGQISRTNRTDDEGLDALLIREGPMCEFVIPGAQNTTVLVVGATSRIGRIVVRKLMLRGYTVKVSSLSISKYEIVALV